MASSDLKEKKFGYVVQPPPCPCPHPHPFPPPPGPIPPGMTVQDWLTYINSYIDLRARQLYDKLKDLKPQGSGGVQSVTYTQSSELGSDARVIGTLDVDQTQTQVKVPTIGIDSASADSFNNPKGPILKFKGVGQLGEDVDVYCENPVGTIFPELRLKDRVTQRIYFIYMENGELKSDIIPTTN